VQALEKGRRRKVRKELARLLRKRARHREAKATCRGFFFLRMRRATAIIKLIAARAKVSITASTFGVGTPSRFLSQDIGGYAHFLVSPGSHFYPDSKGGIVFKKTAYRTVNCHIFQLQFFYLTPLGYLSVSRDQVFRSVLYKRHPPK